MATQVTPAVDGDPVDPGVTPTRRKKRSLLEVLRALRRPKVAVMFALGFSSGLPFLMIGNTLGYWLREGGVQLATIGFLSWAGLAYSFKFVWGAVVDRATPPFVGRLGRRRGWMLWTQALVAAGLLIMALGGPHPGLPMQVGLLVFGAILTGVSAASQDVVIDAWRIEIADDGDELGLLTSAYSIGFRLAIIATDALILVMATAIGWAWSYAAFGLAMSIGMGAALLAKEPAAAAEAKDRAPAWSGRGIYDIVLEPFVAFFRSHGWAAALILAMITLYHLCDYLRGPILNPYYVDLGIPKTTVAGVRASVGLAASISGVIVGGLFSVRFGYMRALIAGGVLQPIAILLFALLAWVDRSTPTFAAVMVFDGFSMSFAGVALVAYMSTLTSLGYTATQYALLTSALAWTGKYLKGYSGQWVEQLHTGGRSLTDAYATFYVIAASVGIPALALVLWLAWVDRGQVRGRATA